MYTSLYSLALLVSSTLAASVAADWQHAKPPCSANVIALATGIHLNIQGQYGEYNATATIADLEAQGANSTAFLIAKGKLLADIQEGMNLRQFNQQIAPRGNAALPGLAKYQTAQRAEAALAQGLTGVRSQDAAALATLKSDITSGIQLNENNLKNATQDCHFELVFPPADETASP
nr:hypothetical protein CFP56_08114 [Quercus suber]